MRSPIYSRPLLCLVVGPTAQMRLGPLIAEAREIGKTAVIEDDLALSERERDEHVLPPARIPLDLAEGALIASEHAPQFRPAGAARRDFLDHHPPAQRLTHLLASAAFRAQ